MRKLGHQKTDDQGEDGEERANLAEANRSIDLKVALLRQHRIDDVNDAIQAVDVRLDHLGSLALPLHVDVLGC